MGLLEPAVQDAHTERPRTLEYLPSAHKLHAVPAVEKRPTEHSTQAETALAPVVKVEVPARHAVQELLPAVVCC